MAHRGSRKDLVDAPTFTAVSSKATTASDNRKATVMQAISQQRSDGSVRTLTFVSQQRDQQQSGEDDDVLSVRAVPSNFVSVSKPSEAIQRLMERKKNSQDACLEDMRTELAATHEKCADEVCESRDRVKIEINNIRKDIDEAKSKIENSDVIWFLCLSSLKDSQVNSNKLSKSVWNEKFM